MIYYKLATGRGLPVWVRILLALGFAIAYGMRFIILPVEAGGLPMPRPRLPWLKKSFASCKRLFRFQVAWKHRLKGALASPYSHRMEKRQQSLLSEQIKHFTMLKAKEGAFTSSLLSPDRK